MYNYSVLNDYGVFLFNLYGSSQKYGISVSKIQEILPCPRVTVMPSRIQYVTGVITIKNGGTIPVVDINQVITGRRTTDPSKNLVVIAKINNTKVAFLASRADRIINISENAILPSQSAQVSLYMQGAVEFNDSLVELIDIDKIINDVFAGSVTLSDAVVSNDAHFENVIAG